MFEWILNTPLDEKNVDMQKLCFHRSRGVFRTLSNICDRPFCKHSQRRLAISYFCKTLHHRYLTRSSTRLSRVLKNILKILFYESISRKNGYHFISEKLRLFERVNINTKFTFRQKFFLFFFEKFKLPSNSFFRWVLVFSGLQLLPLPHRISPRPWPSIYISWTKP